MTQQTSHRENKERGLLENLREAVSAIVDVHRRPDAGDSASRARKHLARSLQMLLRSPSNPDAEQLRPILTDLTEIVSAQGELTELASFKDELNDLHATLSSSTATGPQHIQVLQQGPAVLRADFCRVHRTSPDTVVGLLGTTLSGGAPAAMTTGIMTGALSVATTGMGAQLQAAQVLTILDRALKTSLVDPIPVAMIAWQFERKTTTLRVSSAAHRPLWLIRDGRFRTLRTPPADPLGVGNQGFKQTRIEAETGDILVAMTAGIFEQDDDSGKPIREQDLRLALLDAPQDPESMMHCAKRIFEGHRDVWTVPATLIVARL